MKELYQPKDGRVENEATLTPVMVGHSTTLDPGVTSRVGGGFVMAVIVVGVRSEGGTLNSLDGSSTVFGLLW